LATSTMVSRSAEALSLPLPSAASASLRQIAPPRHRRTFRQPRGATTGSGPRLYVNHGLLQDCVLLVSQGDNSRIRWSASQECEHVLSSDIKPYNKKLLGTSPALLQELALPVNFILRNVSSLAPGFDTGVRLLQGGRRPSTVKSYDQKWLKFENFTAQVQCDAGASHMSVLPASSQTVTIASVILINNCIGYFDLTSAIRDRSSKVEMQITACIQRCSNEFVRCSNKFVRYSRNADYRMYLTFLTDSSGSVLFIRSNLLKRKDL
jgi:hypothetical protein